MNEFVASNGMRLRVAGDGSVRWEPGTPPTRVTAALREFFLAERDAELGRWRSKWLPLYVVYPSKGNEDHEAAFGDGLDCVILRETDGAMKGYVAAEDGWPEGRGGGNEWRVVAREYIAAHPEPKPWHDAQPGEVWVVKTDSQPEQAMTVHMGDFDSNDLRVPITSSLIESARRIWPEVQS